MSTSQDRFTARIGERIQIARKQAKTTQQQLSDRLGFKDRQILSNIEAGNRRVSAEELTSLIDLLQRPLEWFTDPYLIPEERVISWRANRDSVQVDKYEPKARNLVAMFRRLHEQLEIRINPVLPTLNLSKRNSYEDAWMAAEGLVEQWSMGETPANQLPDFLSKLNINVLFVETEDDVSGAACHLPQINVILVNRNQSPWRQNFTTVHESFHLMTWDAMPPAVIDTEYEDPRKAPRSEQISENFSSALLMPQAAIEKRWHARREEDMHDWILRMAKDFGVSGSAMYYRLRNLGLLTDAILLDENVDQNRLVRREAFDKSPLYSETFVGMLRQVLDRGLMSVRKAAKLLDCTIEDLEDIFRTYNMQVPFQL